jgi:diaminopimelate decarboxylase
MGESILTRVAAAVGTPVYVYDAAVVRRRYQELDQAFAGIPHRIFYSVKANSNLAVLNLLRGLGAGADIVSGGELARAMRAGFAGRDVVFSGVGKTTVELAAALEAGVGLINVESAGELEGLRELCRAQGVRARIGMRVNPDVTADTHPYTQTAGKGMKFGVPLDEAASLARCAAEAPELDLVSLGMHIGSQIVDAAHFRAGAVAIGRLAGDVRVLGGDGLEAIDVGGGLGIRYTDERGLTADEFAEAVRPVARETGLAVWLEPGRYITGPAGVLLTRCVYRKHAGGKNFVIVDAGMSDLMRPSLYGACHEIVVIDEAANAPEGPVDVVGPLCETGDFLGLDRRLPGAGPGALLAVLGAGAYGFSMSSTYNSRPRAAEVLVDGDRWAVVRRRETVDDLMRGETAEPAWTA